jgi:hypothetical protein
MGYGWYMEKDEIELIEDGKEEKEGIDSMINFMVEQLKPIGFIDGDLKITEVGKKTLKYLLTKIKT